MMADHTTQGVSLFREIFSGLSHAYGTYDVATGRIRQVKAPVTDQVIRNHLGGRQPYGVYLLVHDRTRAVVADFDEKDLEPVIAFVRGAGHYGLDAHVERSKSKGYHAWLFFEPPGVLAAKARRVVRHILTEIGCPRTEVFPKHDVLDTSIMFGNFIFAPLNGRLVPQGRTVFLRPDDLAKLIEDQWAFLRGIRRIPESRLDEIIEINGLARKPAQSLATVALPVHQRHRSFGLPPCVQRMLAEGVTRYQRVACFRLAVALKKSGIPADLALTTLQAWAGKNRPPQDKRIITAAEVEAQVNGAYRNDYCSYGCEDPAVAPFCDTKCPIHKQSQLQASLTVGKA